MATELKVALAFDDMCLVPCHVPPHRQTPNCSSADRAQMVCLAAAESGELLVDGRELRRSGMSYTVETLMYLRNELGSGVSLSWCVGMDSLVNLTSWHRWRELLDYCHLVVVSRPGFTLPETGEIGQWLALNQGHVEDIHSQPSGKVIVKTLSLLPISATDIRAKRAAGISAQNLLPNAVWHYIEEKHLYLTEEVKS